MSSSVPAQKRPNYGIDAPGTVRTFALLGVSGVVLGQVAYFTLASVQPVLATILWHMGTWPGVSFGVSALGMLYGSKFGKFRELDQLLQAIPWRGDERVLDVGCGHGLLLLGAAKRLTTGKAVGVDLWQQEDQGGNHPDATWENARLEGVADRVENRDGDARKLPFADASFDVVVSSYALHNIYDAAGRQQAVREIVRVLKPGGRVGLIDIRHTAGYARVLRDAGLDEVSRMGPRFTFLIPTFTVTGRKSAHGG
jgi:SAM-dependent methyltransferase